MRKVAASFALCLALALLPVPCVAQEHMDAVAPADAGAAHEAQGDAEPVLGSGEPGGQDDPDPQPPVADDSPLEPLADGADGEGEPSEAPLIDALEPASIGTRLVSYNGHVENVGWQCQTDDPSTWYADGQAVGTSGRGLRLEAFQVALVPGLGGGISYQAHVQNEGWQAAAADGAISGTSGKGLRLEALRLWLSGEVANRYRVYYRVHVQNYGWLDWACDGQVAGSVGMGLRLEGFEVRLVALGEGAPGTQVRSAVGGIVVARGHVQNVGWQAVSHVGTGSVATVGTSGRSLRLEAMRLTSSSGIPGSIACNAHVQNVGWQHDLDDESSWSAGGDIAGSTGRGLRLEAVQLMLTGELGQLYDIYYRAHIQDVGWLGWTCNGQAAGSVGRSKRVEAVQLMVMPKGADGPAMESQALLYDPSFMASLPTGGTAVQARSATVGSTTYLFLPSFADMTALRLGRGADGSDELQISPVGSGTYQGVTVDTPLNMDVLAPATGDGGSRTLCVKTIGAYPPAFVRIIRSEQVAGMFLSSDDPVGAGRAYVEASKDHTAKATGSLVMVEADGGITYDGRLTQIKGRGNLTWTLAKRPYQIKLDKKSDLLGTGDKANRNKTWVLLAESGDPTLMRSYLSLSMARGLGLAESPECAFVDLWYDGEYRGTYVLSEKVQINGGRVEIDEIENTSADGADIADHLTARATNALGYEYQYVTGVVPPTGGAGGYLLEQDTVYFERERSWFKTSKGVFVVKSPEDASQEQVRLISELVQGTIDQGVDPSLFEGALDLDSTVVIWLIQALAKNYDYGQTSTFYYKGGGSNQLVSGPLWDLNNSYGLFFYADALEMTGLQHAEDAFFYRNPVFRSRVREVFNGRFRPLIDSVVLGDASAREGDVRSMEGIVALLSGSQRMDEALWGITSYYDGLLSGRTYDSNVAYLRQWITTRMAYLDSVINGSGWL